MTLALHKNHVVLTAIRGDASRTEIIETQKANDEPGFIAELLGKIRELFSGWRFLLVKEPATQSTPQPPVKEAPEFTATITGFGKAYISRNRHGHYGHRVQNVYFTVNDWGWREKALLLTSDSRQLRKGQIIQAKGIDGVWSLQLPSVSPVAA